MKFRAMSAGPSLEAAAVRLGPRLIPRQVANIALSFATLGLMPEAAAWAALETATARVGPEVPDSMTPQAGPGRCRSPSHRMPFNSTHAASNPLNDAARVSVRPIHESA